MNEAPPWWGFLFTYPLCYYAYKTYMDQIKKTIAGYDKIAKDWHGTRRQGWGEVYKIIDKSIHNLWLVYKNVSQNNREIKILDLGCGNGRLLDFLKGKDYWDSINYTGIDPSSALIQICQENYIKNRDKNRSNKNEQENIKFIINDGIHIEKYLAEKTEGLPNIIDASFDIVISLAVLHHVPQEYQDKWLQEVRAVMNNNSRLILSAWQLAPNVENKMMLDIQKNTKEKINTIHKETHTVHKKINNKECMMGFAQHTDIRYVYNFEIDELRDLLLKNKFKIISQTTEERPNSENRNLIFVCSI